MNNKPLGHTRLLPSSSCGAIHIRLSCDTPNRAARSIAEDLINVWLSVPPFSELVRVMDDLTKHDLRKVVALVHSNDIEDLHREQQHLLLIRELAVLADVVVRTSEREEAWVACVGRVASSPRGYRPGRPSSPVYTARPVGPPPFL